MDFRWEKWWHRTLVSGRRKYIFFEIMTQVFIFYRVLPPLLENISAGADLCKERTKMFTPCG